jgi:predicted porin
MKVNAYKLPLALLATTVLSAPAAFAESSLTSGIKQALSDSKVNVMFRARYEGVDQDGIKEKADALTLKSRITVKSGAYNGFSMAAEVDNVTDAVNNYNSTRNGETQYPVVADPNGTDVNQIFVKYKGDKYTAIAGRQRILHNNQRFVGGVGWRQNEQTYDGYRLQVNPTDSFKIDYSYIYNVNRIFGPRGSKADLHGDFHLVTTESKFGKDHKVNIYAYLLDFDTAAALSSDTYGVSYKGKFGPVVVNAAVATQSEAGDNAVDYSANYYNVEVGSKLGNITLLAGIDSLGSDNGVGFKTPLATLHKFQGFADKFLATPGNGVEDVYFTVKTKVSGVNLSATYHDLSSDKGNTDYGSEIDLAAAYKMNKNYSVLVKYAMYDADDHATDTDKLWVQLVAKF